MNTSLEPWGKMISLAQKYQERPTLGKAALELTFVSLSKYLFEHFFLSSPKNTPPPSKEKNIPSNSFKFRFQPNHFYQKNTPSQPPNPAKGRHLRLLHWVLAPPGQVLKMGSPPASHSRSDGKFQEPSQSRNIQGF